MAEGITVRHARADEAQALTELTLRAKASWGYDDAFMAASRDDLTMTPERLAAWTVWVAEADGVLAGLIALSLERGAEVEEFFVEPRLQGRGIGTLLMAELLAAARAAGAEVLEVDADPNAEPIYARFGFQIIGRSPSGSIPGRTLPRMQLSLTA